MKRCRLVAERYSVQFSKRACWFKGRGKRGNSVWLAAAGLCLPGALFLCLRLDFLAQKADKCHSMFSPLCLISTHSQASSKTAALNPPRLSVHVFPRRRVVQRGKSVGRRRSRRLSSDDAHANPARATCPPPAPPHTHTHPPL